MLPGLLSSMLPGLEEQSKEQEVTIKDLFKLIRLKIGDPYFFGAVWSIVLRTIRLRSAGLLYLKYSIPQYNTFFSLFNNENSEDNIAKYFPNIDTMVLQTVFACNKFCFKN